MSSSSEDAHNAICTKKDMALSTFHTTITGELILCLVIIFFLFIAQMEKVKSRLDRLLIISFFIISTAAMCFLIPLANSVCFGFSHDDKEMIENVFICFYTAEVYLVVVIFFNKTIETFKGSQYEVSSLTRKIYIALLLVLYPLCVSVIFLIWIENHAISELIAGAGSVLLLLSLAALFVSKLFSLYRITCSNTSSTKHISKIIEAITKITVLTLIATVTTAFHLVIGSTMDHSTLLYQYAELADVASNAFCVILCLQQFVNTYTKICFPLDKCCWFCCSRFVSCFFNTGAIGKDMKHMRTHVCDPSGVQSMSSITTKNNATTKTSELTVQGSHAASGRSPSGSPSPPPQ
eukprot:1192_1